MNIREMYGLACNNIRGRKRIGNVISVIFFLTLFIYLLVNSMADSVDRMVRLTEEMPMAKTLTFTDRGDLPEDFLEGCKAIKHVDEVYTYGKVYGDATGLHGEKRESVETSGYSNAYEEYMVKGEPPKKGEILFPHYMNLSTEGRYDDGSEYIGKNITIYVENYNDEEKAYTYTVSGTYDNIYARMGVETMFVLSEDAVEMKKYSYIGGKEYAEKKMELNPSVMYVGYEYEPEYAVVVDEYKNVEAVQRQLYENLGISTFVEVDVSENELQKAFDVVEMVVAILTVILLIAVIIMMLITIGNDIRSRKKEMAVYMVQGYTRKQLVQVLGMEYALKLSPVLIVAMVVNIVTMMFLNLAIEKLCTAEYQLLHMGMGIGTFIVGVLILFILVGAVVYKISGHLKDIDLLKEIKCEG